MNRRRVRRVRLTYWLALWEWRCACGSWGKYYFTSDAAHTAARCHSCPRPQLWRFA